MPCKLHCDRTLQLGWNKFCSRFCLHNCPSFCNITTNPNLPHRPPPSLPLPLPPRPFPSSLPLQQHADHFPGRILLLVIVIVTATIIVSVFMVCVLFKKLRQYRQSRREFPRRRNGPVLSDSDIQRENFADDDQQPVFDHHVWYINTIGLQQSVIDSITMFKYRKDEKLIDGTDCSVCLGEFQEDESLRLLPKCSHAFHAPCIDTWLRSHKNCPLCRAPVVSNSAAPNLTPAEPITNEPQPTQMETLEEEDSSFPRNNQVEVGGDETSGEGASNINSNSRSDSEVPIKGLSRTLSDLAENQNRQAVEDEGQGVRRSVSMDSVSAMVIYEATGNIQIPEEACSSSGTLVEVKNPVWRNIPLRKPGIQNQSLYNLVKSISFGRSMQKGATSMKRFNSSSRKPVWSRHCRSHSSVLPL